MYKGYTANKNAISPDDTSDAGNTTTSRGNYEEKTDYDGNRSATLLYGRGICGRTRSLKARVIYYLYK